MLPSIRVCTVLDSHLTDLADSAHHPDPVIRFQSTSPPLSSVPDLLSSAVSQGEIQYAESLRLRDCHRTRLAEDGRETSLTSFPTAEPASTNPQRQDSDWKATAKEGLEVASRFVQTLLKKVPDCVDTNPVKAAFSIARAIIEIKDVGRRICISGTG